MIFHLNNLFFSSVALSYFDPPIFISGTCNLEKLVGQDPSSFEEKDRFFYSQRDSIFFTGEVLFYTTDWSQFFWKFNLGLQKSSKILCEYRVCRVFNNEIEQLGCNLEIYNCLGVTQTCTLEPSRTLAQILDLAGESHRSLFKDDERVQIPNVVRVLCPYVGTILWLGRKLR